MIIVKEIEQSLFVDRIKDLIKARGWQVPPIELEDVLLIYLAVLDVAVVGAVDYI